MRVPPRRTNYTAVARRVREQSRTRTPPPGVVTAVGGNKASVDIVGNPRQVSIPASLTVGVGDMVAVDGRMVTAILARGGV